ncbi:hypothetical protein EKN06_10690 [Croceicoccus ponticola]|uniref:Uncharacterized protein n=1 Tax=Croceicoccus ponticola TaxID=2217664 RepID=A0A437GX31_9SPHN|nr:hypothetical protein [Croceicoccus ponticola]RVQ66481.1 hypothetical protein EKN06_10690 [Croceicoccus ponticola]
MNTERDPAFSRWLVIQALRTAGMVLFIYGLLAANGRAPWFAGVPREWAMVLSVIGMFDVFVVPILLSRKWSSNKT